MERVQSGHPTRKTQPPLNKIDSPTMKPSDRIGSAESHSEPVSEADLELLTRQLLRFFSSPNRQIPGLEPEDLVQKALVRVYQGMDKFRQDASFKTWAFKIATNVWTNTLRGNRTQKRTGDETSLDEGFDDTTDKQRLEPAAPAPSPEEELLWDERTNVLDQGIAMLPARMARCVMLSLKGGFTNREIATLLKIEPTTVKSQLKEARQRLGRLLREHFGLLEPEREPP